MKSFKNSTLLILAFFIVSFSYSQTAMLANDQKVYKASDMKLLPPDAPNFEGGIEALNEYLQDNLNYPDLSKRQGMEGTVILEFEINKEGEIGEITVEKSVCKEINEEAIRLVENMPNWKPAMQNGQAQAVKFQLPIIFELKN
jgi:periplasmic protein TonB